MNCGKNNGSDEPFKDEDFKYPTLPTWEEVLKC